MRPDSDGLGGHGAGASRFVRTAAYDPPVEGRSRRNRKGDLPRDGLGHAGVEGGEDLRSLMSFVLSVRTRIRDGLLHFVLVEWLSATGRFA